MNEGRTPGKKFSGDRDTRESGCDSTSDAGPPALGRRRDAQAEGDAKPENGAIDPRPQQGRPQLRRAHRRGKLTQQAENFVVLIEESRVQLRKASLVCSAYSAWGVRWTGKRRVRETHQRF